MNARRQKISQFMNHLRTLFSVRAEDVRPYWKWDAVVQDDNLHTFNCTWSVVLGPPCAPAQKVTILFTVEVDENTLRGTVETEILWKTQKNDEARLLPTDPSEVIEVVSDRSLLSSRCR